MKVFFLSIIIFSILGIKFVVTDQINQIKKLEKEIYKIDGEIEKLKTDYSYVSSPQNLKKINQTELKLYPIQQIDIIKLQDE
tara:strand:+ start:142 stop:387 length:246 start_codon:yes stop_codon:yes gene_type:complete